MKCILASRSPRRKQILEGLGLTVQVSPSSIDETFHPDRDPGKEVERLAADKIATLGNLPVNAFGVAADTVVMVEERVLGKPRDVIEAKVMLEGLSGRWHRVLTGIALTHRGRIEIAHTATEVEMASLTPREIAWYVGTGEPMDKAGAYGIQGLGGIFITAIRGSYSNVVGLPIHTLYTLLEAMDLGDTIVSRHAQGR